MEVMSGMTSTAAEAERDHHPGLPRPSGRADPPSPFTSAEELIAVQAMAARVACERMTAPALRAVCDSVEWASGLPTRPGWERKAAAHADIFRLLAGVPGGQAAASQHRWAWLIRDLMLTVGPVANGMISSSRQRLLAHLRARDADGAALEMENHLKVLHHMWRLTAARRQVS
jgi:GntR family transcriptional regulator, transcriptional repressor for pyruvate dehydrogenase complex